MLYIYVRTWGCNYPPRALVRPRRLVFRLSRVQVRRLDSWALPKIMRLLNFHIYASCPLIHLLCIFDYVQLGQKAPVPTEQLSQAMVNLTMLSIEGRPHVFDEIRPPSISRFSFLRLLPCAERADSLLTSDRFHISFSFFRYINLPSTAILLYHHYCWLRDGVIGGCNSQSPSSSYLCSLLNASAHASEPKGKTD